MRALASVLIFAVGLVNLLPVSGALSAARLEALYGLGFDEPNLLILMRHRAVLFGIVGGLLVASALRPRVRPLAVGAGLVSMLSFVAVALLVGGYNAQLQRVVVVDVVASLALVAAVAISRGTGRGRTEA